MFTTIIYCVLYVYVMLLFVLLVFLRLFVVFRVVLLCVHYSYMVLLFYVVYLLSFMFFISLYCFSCVSPLGGGAGHWIATRRILQKILYGVEGTP